MLKRSTLHNNHKLWLQALLQLLQMEVETHSLMDNFLQWPLPKPGKAMESMLYQQSGSPQARYLEMQQPTKLIVQVTGARLEQKTWLEEKLLRSHLYLLVPLTM
jgi:hypothetical protein